MPDDEGPIDRKGAMVTLALKLTREAIAPHTDLGQGIHEVAPDIAYQRIVFVNVVFLGLPGAGDGNWVLVDAGLMGSASAIMGAAERRYGSARPAGIVLTHGHFDHVGALEDLALAWDVPIYAHARELPYLSGVDSYPPPDMDVGYGTISRLAPLFPRRPIDVSDRLVSFTARTGVPILPGWRVFETPGHSPGHVSFWREADRSLVAGDAFVATGQGSIYEMVQQPEMHGPPRGFTRDWPEAGRSVAMLSALEPSLVVTGHGRALRGKEMRDALHCLATRFDAIAVPPRRKIHIVEA